MWIRVMHWGYQFSINMSQFIQDGRQRLGLCIFQRDLHTFADDRRSTL